MLPGSIHNTILVGFIVVNMKDNPEICEHLKRFLGIVKPSLHRETLPHYTSYCQQCQHPLFRASLPRWLAHEKVRREKSVFNQMLKLGIIRPCKRTCALPLHLVSKDSGNWRVCRDIHDVTAMVQVERIFT